MGSASHLGDVRRYGKLRSSKKSLLLEPEPRTKGLANQRSISLSALHQTGVPLEPRMARLETLEAKMASIEVSLSTTPRRKKSGAGHSTLLQTTNKEAPKEIRGNLSDKENLIHRREGVGSSMRPGNLDSERRLAQERLNRLKPQLEAKRHTINNLKLALDSINVTDNIDVRIQQAELEFQLGREELELLSLLEESSALRRRLDEPTPPHYSLYSLVVGRAVSLHSLELLYDGKNLRLSSRPDGPPLVEWAPHGSGLQPGDRLLEVNGCWGGGQDLELEAGAVARVVVARTGADAALGAEVARARRAAAEAEAARRAAVALNTRLSHRISYLEDQVADILRRSTHHHPLQVFQKGQQLAVLTSGSPEKGKIEGIDKPKRKRDLAEGAKREEIKPRGGYDSEPARRGERPVPPKKPARLSLHKARSLQSVTGEKRRLRGSQEEHPRWC